MKHRDALLNKALEKLNMVIAGRKEQYDAAVAELERTASLAKIMKTMDPRLHLTDRFYGWFTPAIDERDFALRPQRTCDLDRALDFLAVCTT